MSFTSTHYSSELCEKIFSVENAHHNLRLDQFLKNHLGQMSRQFIQKKIFKGEIAIEGRYLDGSNPPPLRPSTLVKSGQWVKMITYSLPLNHIDEEVWNGSLLKLEDFGEPQLIAKQTDWILINKPPFMATHPTGRHLFHTATTYFENVLKESLHSVHRLDRETSGLLLLARNPQGARFLTSQFEEAKVKKAYLLLVSYLGQERPEERFPLVADFRLGVDDGSSPQEDLKGHTRVRVAFYPSESSMGKRALTRFQWVYGKNNMALLLAFPQTGRQHQIRVHSAALGFPLIGDKLYNGDPELFGRFKDKRPTEEDFKKMMMPRQALHAIGLNFETQDSIPQTFMGPFPEDWWGLIETTWGIEDRFEFQQGLSLSEKVKVELDKNY